MRAGSCLPRSVLGYCTRLHHTHFSRANSSEGHQSSLLDIRINREAKIKMLATVENGTRWRLSRLEREGRSRRPTAARKNTWEPRPATSPQERLLNSKQTLTMKITCWLPHNQLLLFKPCFVTCYTLGLAVGVQTQLHMWGFGVFVSPITSQLDFSVTTVIFHLPHSEHYKGNCLTSVHLRKTFLF